MLIRRLDISGLRNIEQASLSPLATINIISGKNGAGKTSVLEAIHLLSSAKTFRSHKLNPLINFTSDNCIAYAEVELKGRGYQPIGVERSKIKEAPGVIRIAGQTIKSAASLAEAVPVQIISSDTFKLLEGAPAIRRKFLDWGVFHVEPQFHEVWKSAARCLKQRNSLLRHARMDESQLAIWTEELAKLGELLDVLRQRYIQQLVPVFEESLSRLIELDGDLRLSYNRGWDKDRSLFDVLMASIQSEKEQGFTRSGPHRADLRLRYNGVNAADVLSRGQQKMVVCALRLAQGKLLSSLRNKPCVFLVDDLPSELDKERRQALCSLLESSNSQVFITCVDEKELLDCWSGSSTISLFHVEHGKITSQ